MVYGIFFFFFVKGLVFRLKWSSIQTTSSSLHASDVHGLIVSYFPLSVFFQFSEKISCCWVFVCYFLVVIVYCFELSYCTQFPSKPFNSNPTRADTLLSEYTPFGILSNLYAFLLASNYSRIWFFSKRNNTTQKAEVHLE